jgi:hypothetical protein
MSDAPSCGDRHYERCPECQAHRTERHLDPCSLRPVVRYPLGHTCWSPGCLAVAYDHECADHMRCPTLCDPDCGVACHASHAASVKRDHEPDECPSSPRDKGRDEVTGS